MELFHTHKTYDFMGKNKLIFSISAVIMLISFWLILGVGFKYGVDFSGGTVVQVRYEKAPDIQKIRDLLKGSELKNAEIQEFGSQNEILLRFQNSTHNVTKDAGDTVVSALKDSGKFEIRRVEIIGPKVGDELRKKGLMALLISTLGILIYVGFRFEWRFGVAAILGVVHDVVITAGCVVLFGIEFDLTVLAALLMLMGHSINDTIVIFDRIRETIKEAKPNDEAKYSLSDIINDAVTRTLSRTTLTVATVFFVILTLYMFGGEIIHGFAFAMLVGSIIGAYSSIFIASPFVLWTGYDVAKEKAKEGERVKLRIEKEKMRDISERGTI